ncbi:MAG: T9SS type A sorting domain-containing protein [Crocinitomicaceae bacterium]|nr:T9SS type A sorting domain-containing protein [Crocinitomicaceae bacterium]
MKALLILLVTYVSILGLCAQENLVPNGHFDENTNQYAGGTDPVNYYTANQNCSQGRDRFESDITSWYVATSDAQISDLQNPWTRRCSPDWIASYTYDYGTTCTATNSSFYVASGFNVESVMVELKNGYTLIKGQTYKFRVKARSAVGSGSFQLVFSTKSEGLQVQPHKKWVAADFYLSQDCNWSNYEVYFTVPNDDENDYEDMKYLVLQYNHEQNQDALGGKVTLHYDDVFLAEGQQCEDYKYIQDWQYFETHKIEQANIQISAGAYVSPYAWDNNLPVIVKSTAKVIYRAPSIYLEPGFFIEEEGSYFETQTGSCVTDPCPPITPYIAEISTLCNTSPVTLGTNISDVAGVFYEWQPHEYFSAPWSKVTDFTPPTGSGCVDAKLIVWTLCGAIQEFPFNVDYFDAPPTITMSNVINNANEFSFNASISNASSYTIEAINTTTGAVVYEDIQSDLSCGTTTGGVTDLISFTPCNASMCDDIQVTITATNDCFATVTETLLWSSPPPVAPSFQVVNLNETTYDYSFDITNIPAEFEYLQIHVLNGSQTSAICSETLYSCDYPNLTDYHYDISQCLSGCLSACKDYVIRVRIKNVCYPTLATEYLAWNRDEPFAMPVNYPNIVTPNGDGANDVLCFEPQGADWWYLVVTNSWGNVYFEGSGCVNTNPVCLWTPPQNINDGTYTYIVQFGNQCGAIDDHQDFVQVVNGWSPIFDGSSEDIASENLKDEINFSNESESLVREEEQLKIFPNPSNDQLTIRNSELIEQIWIYDNTGSLILHESPNNSEIEYALRQYGSGMYTIHVVSEKINEHRKIVIL